MKHIKQRITFVLAIGLVLLLIAPEMLTAMHLTQAHHHEDDTTCQICVQLATLVEQRTPITASACVILVVLAVVFQILSFHREMEPTHPKTLVTLSVKMSN